MTPNECLLRAAECMIRGDHEGFDKWRALSDGLRRAGYQNPSGEKPLTLEDLNPKEKD